MRVECESCRELVAARFAVEGAAVRATCPGCGHVTSAPALVAGAPALPVAAADDPPDDAALCPKCGAPRRAGAAACASCGLAVDRIAAYTDARDAAVPEAVRGAWARATEAWDDAGRHDQLLRLVATHSCYAWAANRYRTRRGDGVAERQLERLRRAAEATLLASATARPDPTAAPYRATRGVLAILIVAVLVGLVYAMAARDPAPAPSAAVPGAPVRPLVPGHPVSPSTIK